MPTVTLDRSSSTKPFAILTAILVLYAASRLIEILPFSTPSTPIVAVEILSALAFALVHGTREYRLRGILVFCALCLVIGNTIENIGVITGIPYGDYVFLPLMGPQIFHVPALLGLAYIGMAYASWTLARIILGVAGPRLAGSQLIAVPLLASVIMTSWDLAQDPVWSTLLHAWRWRDGGLWFGVPLTNFAGWLLTVSLIYLCFALYLRLDANTSPASTDPRPAVVLYAVCATGNVLQLLRPQPLSVVADPTGTTWHTAAILCASALVSIFVMGSVVLLAGLRLRSSLSSGRN